MQWREQYMLSVHSLFGEVFFSVSLVCFSILLLLSELYLCNV